VGFSTATETTALAREANPRVDSDNARERPLRAWTGPAPRKSSRLIGPALRALNKLRNDFGHDLEMRLTDERVNGLYGALSPRLRSITPNASPDIDVAPRNRFIPMAIMMRVMLLGMIRQVEKRLGEGP